MLIIQVILVSAGLFGSGAATVTAAANGGQEGWQRVFEKQNSADGALDPQVTHELLQQLAGNKKAELASGGDQRDNVDELVAFCRPSDDKCTPGYLRDLSMKSKYRALMKQWTLSKYLDKCLVDQERLCTRDIDAAVEMGLGKIGRHQVELIGQLIEELRSRMFARGVVTFSEKTGQRPLQVFNLCQTLVDALAEPLARYRWLKDEGLGKLVVGRGVKTESWLTNGERCHYVLQNRSELGKQLAKHIESSGYKWKEPSPPPRQQGRFADSRPAAAIKVGA